MPNLSLFQGLTGRQGTPTGGGVKDLIIAAFGTTKRGGPDTRAAAEHLGVSQRSVQRWIAGENRKQRNAPRADRLSALRTTARQAATTRTGRKAALSDARARFATRKTARLTTYGVQGPLAAGKSYSRLRPVTLELGSADIDALFDAYERGGDKAVQAWMSDHFSENYVPDWGFERIDKISLQ